MVSVSSSTATANSTALTLIKGSTQSAAAATKQSAASQILSSISGVNLDPLKQAEGQITRILLESGGQFIVGGAFSDITGTDKDDIIFAGPGSWVNGGAGNDKISGSFQMNVSGGAGDDTISVSSDSTIDGGDGNDTLSVGIGSKVTGGDGNDAITIGRDNTLNAGAGDDAVNAWRNNTIDAGAGDDTIHVGIGNVVTAGTGNDKITISGIQAESGSSGSTVKYAVGDGQDSLTLIRSASTLELGEGFTAENTKVTITGNKATISFDGNENDRLSVDFLFDSALTLSFADGSTLEVKPAQTTAPSFVSSYGQV